MDHPESKVSERGTVQNCILKQMFRRQHFIRAQMCPCTTTALNCNVPCCTTQSKTWLQCVLLSPQLVHTFGSENLIKQGKTSCKQQ